MKQRGGYHLHAKMFPIVDMQIISAHRNMKSLRDRGTPAMEGWKKAQLLKSLNEYNYVQAGAAYQQANGRENLCREEPGKL